MKRQFAPLYVVSIYVCEGTMCTVTGWGTTSEGGDYAEVLQKVDVPVVSDDYCREAYGPGKG